MPVVRLISIEKLDNITIERLPESGRWKLSILVGEGVAYVVYLNTGATPLDVMAAIKELLSSQYT